jgi:glycosyltransferase involved in cell wall biosynthesis
MRKKTVAIFSPGANAYSETFIQAHRQLPFNIKFYYEGIPPSKLEGDANLLAFSFFEKIKQNRYKDFSLLEYGLYNSLKKQQVDCVLAEYGPTAGASIKVIKKLGLPLVVHFHGFDSSRKDIIAEYIDSYKAVFSYANKVVAVSNQMKADLVAMGCPQEKILVTPCGPDASFFDVCPQYDSLQFVSIGRFVNKKAPQLTIKAFKLVTEIFPEARLVMVGEGALLNECCELASLLDLETRVHFAGVLSRDSIQQVMAGSIAFVQHSVVANNGDSEGTPVAVLEAQAAALPVLATFHAGIPDVVIHSETGLLTDEHDVAGMAGNMVRILSTPGLAKELGTAGKKRVKENFTLEKHLQLLTNTIEEAIQ